MISGYDEIEIPVRRVSESGIGSLLHRKIRFGDSYPMKVRVGKFQMSEISVQLVWAKDDGSCGFTINKADSPYQPALM